MTEKDMHDEISALVGAIAKAFDMDEREAAKAVEEDRIRVELGEDEGGRFVRVSAGGKAARIYQGAIYREPEVEDGGCGGGCGCGR